MNEIELALQQAILALQYRSTRAIHGKTSSILESPQQVSRELNVEFCTEFLARLGFDQSIDLESTLSRECLLVRIVVSIIDLPVVNYASAHLDHHPFSKYRTTIDLLELYSAIHGTKSQPLFLKRCRFNCLDQFYN